MKLDTIDFQSDSRPSVIVIKLPNEGEKDMQSLKDTLHAYEKGNTEAAVLMQALERENLYVPFEVSAVGQQKIELPVLITLSDASKCIAVFSSDTVIDKKFYNRYCWKRMGYQELEALVLRFPVKRDVIIDPYSESPFVIIAASRKNAETTTDAELDTDTSGFEKPLEQACLYLPTVPIINRAYALKYRVPGTPDALCFVIDLNDYSDPEHDFNLIYKGLQNALGPSIPMLLLSYSEVRAELKQLGADPCYSLKR